MGILDRLFEKRDHPSNPSDAMLYMLGGGIQTNTGKSVSEDTAITYIPVFAAVRLLSEIIASLPLHLYRRLPRGKERAIDHPLYSIMHLKPNPEMSSMLLRETMMGHLLMWGNCYLNIERDGANRVKALWPLLPGNMTAKRINGELIYLYRVPSGKTIALPRDQVLHIAGFSKDGIMGLNIINKGREAIGLGLALEEYGERFFANGGKPPVALEHPGELSEKAQERLRKAWSDMHQGLTNAHRLAILEEGMTLKEYGISPEDAQALESKKFQVTEIARLFNIPPHMLKDLERSTYSNIEMQSLEFIIYSLRTWLIRKEQAFSLQLLTDQEQNDYFFEHLVEGLLRGDITSRYAAYAVGRNNGWLSANDIRELENMNPLESGGDVYLVPLNMQPVNWITDNSLSDQENNRVLENDEIRKAASITGRNRIKKSYHNLFQNTMQRIINKETIAIKRNVKKHLTQRNLRSFNDWLDNFYKDMPDYIDKNFHSVFMSFAEAIYSESANSIDISPDITQEMREFIDDYMRSYSVRHINTSLGQLKKIIDENKIEDLSEIIEKRMDEWTESRPNRITNNEIVRGDGAVASFLFLAAGYKLIWRTTGSPCDFCAGLNGKIVGSGQYFVNENSLLEADGQTPMKINTSRLHPPLHAGCSCFIDRN